MGNIVFDFDKGKIKKLSFSAFLALKKNKVDIPPWREICNRQNCFRLCTNLKNNIKE